MQQPPQPPYGPQGQPYPPDGTQYGPPQMQPVPQPPRKKSRKKPIIFGCLGAIVLLFVIIVIAAVATNGGASQATAPTPTPVTQARATTAPTTAPTAVPTQAPTPTPVPTKAPSGLPATNGRPVLGGPVSDFVGKFGQPNDHSIAGEQYHFLRVPGQALDGLIIATSPDNQMVDDITVATPDPGWTPTDAESHCLAYAPLDYHFKQKIPYADNSGYDMIYSSAELSKAFPAADFTDGSSNQVTPGLFDISYLYGSDGQHIGDCDMIIGEQQTNG
jgi:hypothetical protein